MAEYASKGVANAGLTTGIIGTTLGVLNNGGLGNILGGGQQPNAMMQLQAENAMLKANNYSDKTAIEAYKQSVADNKELRAELYAFIKPLADEAAQNRVNIATLAAEQKCCCEKQVLRDEILAGKINEVAQISYGRFNTLDQTIACLAGKVDGITKTVVPNSAVCPGWGDVCINPNPCPSK